MNNCTLVIIWISPQLSEIFRNSNDIFTCSEVNSKINIFNDVMVRMLNDHAPLITHRDIAKRNLKLDYTIANRKLYNALRNKVNQMESDAKDAYLKSRLNISVGMKTMQTPTYQHQTSLLMNLTCIIRQVLLMIVNRVEYLQHQFIPLVLSIDPQHQLLAMLNRDSHLEVCVWRWNLQSFDVNQV